MFSKYLGDAEKQIRRIFQRARKAAPCIVFIDELDAVGGKRGESQMLCFERGTKGEKQRDKTVGPLLSGVFVILITAGSTEADVGVRERVLTQLLTELDGVQVRHGVFAIGCTNRPDLLDEALLRPGRLDTLLYVGAPSATDRMDILRVQLARGGVVCAAEMDLSVIATRTEGFSGADLSALCRESVLDALAELSVEWRRAAPLVIQQRHFEQVLVGKRVRATISASVLDLFNHFRT